MDALPRPSSLDPSIPTVAGRLRLRLGNDNNWRQLFDSTAIHSCEEIEEALTSCDLFRNPRDHPDFLENNTLQKIVQDLVRTVKTGNPRETHTRIERGFARLTDVLFGRDPSRRALTLMLMLTPLCATSPSNLKTTLGEPIDMGVLCGHDDETRMAWRWFKSLLATLLAFFWPGFCVSSSSSSSSSSSTSTPVNRDTLEMQEVLKRASVPVKQRHSWKVVVDHGNGKRYGSNEQEDWLTASFYGRYRTNATRCWWRKNGEDDDLLQETSLDELIAARITGTCQEDGLKGMWLGGVPDLVLSACELRSLWISTDPWECIDQTPIPLTKATTDVFEIPAEFDPSTLLPRPGVHEVTGIPFETLRGFPCAPKQRYLFL